MEKYDFVNLESEWWHWSYGDRYWAVKKNKEYTLYEPVQSI
jgi:D-alanyl-D-alanine dipeptidase